MMHDIRTLVEPQIAEEYGYRDSHTTPTKGADYDENYRTRPWRRFLWPREQKALDRILAKYFAGREIDLLDFACGTGRITSFLENRVNTSTGVDVSE
jgi:cyclopropane fatty-acyl-phospholipid synthase-like methyltransferase